MKYPIPDEALDDRLAIVGTAGSGKTYAVTTAVERLLDQSKKIVVIDPLGVSWGLRLKANGKDAAYPVVIFGGSHGDIGITEQSGRLIGEAIVGMRESCIVDLSELGSKSAERRFMLGLLEAMYRSLKAGAGEPFHLIFDEADLWAPQRALEPQLLSLMENIVRRGRVKGFIPWLITQRPASISKDVLSQADGLVAMKLTGRHDRDALGAWIEGQADKSEEKSFKAKLPTLKRGTGILWIPGRQILGEVAFPTKSTFDSSSTPKRGETRRTAVLKALDVDALKLELAALESQKTTNTKTAAATPAPTYSGPSPAAIELQIKVETDRAFAAGKSEGRQEGIGIGERTGETRGFQKAVREAQAAAQAALAALKPAEPSLASLPPRPRTEPSVPVPSRLAPLRPAPTASASASGIAPAMQRILNALAWLEMAGIREPSKEVAAYMAGASSTSSVYANNLGALRSQHAYIEYPRPGVVCLTASGRAIAEPPEMPPTLDALHDAVRTKLPPALCRLLDVLLAIYPKEIEKADAAERAGASPTSSVFANNLGRLRSLGFIDYPRPGLVAATALLFPEGLRAA